MSKLTCEPWDAKFVIAIPSNQRMEQCPHRAPNMCPQCASGHFVQSALQESFWLFFFETLENATMWKVSGHLTPATVCDSEGVWDQLAKQIAVRRNRMKLEEQAASLKRQEEEEARWLLKSLTPIEKVQDEG